MIAWVRRKLAALYARYMKHYGGFDMGGQYEGAVETPAKKDDTIKSGPVNVGKLRTHESGGEVHFHDDANGIKAVVPKDRYMKHIDDLLTSQRQEYEHLCPEHGSAIFFKLQYTFVPPDNIRRYEVEVTVEKVEFGTNYKQLAIYTGRRK